MQGLIGWWARNSVAANLLMFACVVIGLFAFRDINREVFPSAKVPFVDISVTWLGADPQQVEEQIVLRIEEAIDNLDGVKNISSTAREGRANVTVEADSEADITTLLNELKNR
ncbi:MAG: efflux RND transporter permease subunit, partial [Pseudomonadota bacterium]